MTRAGPAGRRQTGPQIGQVGIGDINPELMEFLGHEQLLTRLGFVPASILTALPGRHRRHQADAYARRGGKALAAGGGAGWRGLARPHVAHQGSRLTLEALDQA
jgi:hypothetical protein